VRFYLSPGQATLCLCLVGENESGKPAWAEALSKLNRVATQRPIDVLDGRLSPRLLTESGDQRSQDTLGRNERT